ncbi:ATP-binding cassette domain-containing protein [Lachnospiraceae bacterium ZAX-1]
MYFKYDDIVIKNKLLIEKGVLSLPSNGIIIFTGENGTGKTLFLNKLHLESKESTCFVSQFSEVIPNLSVLENISMLTDLVGQAIIKDFLKDHNLEYLLNLTPSTMSGGEKRLLSFLRGVLSKSKIILLDEPSNDLDYKITDKVLEIIAEYSSEKLFIIATHDKRFNDIKNGGISVVSHKLILSLTEKCQIEELLDDMSSVTLLDNNCDESVDIIKKIWNNRIVLSLVLIALSFLSNYMIWVANTPEELPTSKLPNDQTCVYLSVSQIGGYIYNNGSLRMDFAKKLTSSNIWFTDDSENEKNYGKLTYDLMLIDSDNYKVYPLEFFVQEERRYLFTLDVYLQNILDLDIEENYVDLIDEISVPEYTMNGNGQKFDSEVFEKAVQYIHKNYPSAQPVYYAVKFQNQYTYSDFISQNFQKYENPDAYVYSRDTASISNQISEIITYKSTFNSMIVFCIIFLIVEVFYLLIYIKAKSKQIRLLLNFGVDRMFIIRNIVRRNNNLFIRFIIMFGLLTVTTIIFACSSNGFIFAKYLPIICVLLFAYSGYYLEKKILQICLQYICSWKYRY